MVEPLNVTERYRELYHEEGGKYWAGLHGEEARALRRLVQEVVEAEREAIVVLLYETAYEYYDASRKLPFDLAQRYQQAERAMIAVADGLRAKAKDAGSDALAEEARYCSKCSEVLAEDYHYLICSECFRDGMENEVS